MSQVINTNIASLSAQRNLNQSQGQLQQSLERLSSGLRINSAKDDAAGLAISERFSSQIRGMDQAIRNSNDGISFAQTAEGALQEIGDLLQRVRELAVQSANDTNSASDRAALDQEVQQAVAEINRIASTTQFNDQNILDGTREALTFQVGANTGQTINFSGVDSRGNQLGAVIAGTKVDDVSLGNTEVSRTDGGEAVLSFANVELDGGNNVAGTLSIDGRDLVIDVDADVGTNAENMEAIANAIRTAIANDAGLNEEDYEVSSNATDQTVSITNLSEANVSVVSSLRTDSGNIVSETGGEAKAAEITATSDVGVLGNPGTGNYTVSNFSFTMGGSTVDLTDAVSGTYVTDADLAEALNSAITQQPEFAGIQGIDATDFGFSVTGGTDVQFTNTTLEAVNISLSVDGTGDGDSVSDQTISAGTLDTSGATDSVDTTGAFDISLGSTGTINITGVGEFEFSVERGSTLTTLANAIEDTIRTQAGNEDIAVTVDGDKLVFTNSGFTDFNFDLDLEDGANAALFDDTLQGAVVQDLNQYFGSGETVNFEVSLGEEKFVINDARSLTDVAGAINARSSDTGIRANVSSDGRDINFSTDRGGEFEVTLKADVGGTGEFEVNTAVSANAADNSSFVDGFGVDTLDRANETLLVADYAIQQVNSLRADMGSIQNRLEATISNLTVGSENLSGARSRIVDADFASETAALTRAQILQQAGTSVLAQANQAPQNVLALLQ